MRRLIFTRGAQGLGKSSLLRALNLTPFTLCPDDLRALWGAPVWTDSGRWMVNHNHEAEVWAFLGERLEERMSRGELVVVDATHTYQPGLEGYARLIERFGYRALCLDLSQRSLEEALEGNARRPWRARVPDQAVERVWGAARQPLPPSLLDAGCEVLSLSPEGPLEGAREALTEGVRRWLLSEERPLSELNGEYPLVWGGWLPTSNLTQALTQALTLLDAQQSEQPHLPTFWLSPLNTLFGEQAPTDEQLSTLAPLLQQALQARPQLSLLRGPQERERPWWLAAHLNDAARWLCATPEGLDGEGRACLDVAWSLPLTPPPVLSLTSDQALLRAPSERSAQCEPPFGWRQGWWPERALALGLPEQTSDASDASDASAPSARGVWLTCQLTDQGHTVHHTPFALLSPRLYSAGQPSDQSSDQPS